MPARESFGERLRAERERAGVSLETIVQSTKIQRSLLVGLENNDVSQWPVGIFRRAFFREYLAAIGIRSEAVVAEFVRLFPESGEPVPLSDGMGGLDTAGEMRLQLAPAASSSARRWMLQSAASASDLCAILVLSAWVVVLFHMQVWPTTAAVALLYYGASVAWLGRTPGLWWFFREPSAIRNRARAIIAESPALRIVSRQDEDSAAAGAESHVA